MDETAIQTHVFFKFMIAQNGLLLDFYEGEPTRANAVSESGKCSEK